VLGNSGSITVNFGTSNGTAKAGPDYRTATGTLSWADGDAAPKTFSMVIRNDPVRERDETVVLTLSTPTGGAILGTLSRASLRILDDDPVQRRIDFAQAASAAAEGVMLAKITVVLSQASTKTVTVRYAVAGGTAKTGADYTLLGNGTLTFAPGQKRKVVQISIINDTVAEFDETIIVRLFVPKGCAVGVANVTHVSDPR
jgi:serine protease